MPRRTTTVAIVTFMFFFLLAIPCVAQLLMVKPGEGIGDVRIGNSLLMNTEKFDWGKPVITRNTSPDSVAN
jgi:Fe2+ transport system protein B